MKKMLNKQDLVTEIVHKTGLSKKDANNALKAFVSTISDSLAKGKGVRLVGFGSFTVRHRAARKGRNPQTGASIKISARDVPAFKAGRGLRKAANK